MVSVAACLRHLLLLLLIQLVRNSALPSPTQIPQQRDEQHFPSPYPSVNVIGSITTPRNLDYHVFSSHRWVVRVNGSLIWAYDLDLLLDGSNVSRIAWTYSIANVDTLSWCGMNESTVPCHFSIDFFYDPLERLIIAFVEPGLWPVKGRRDLRWRNILTNDSILLARGAVGPGIFATYSGAKVDVYDTSNGRLLFSRLETSCLDTFFSSNIYFDPFTSITIRICLSNIFAWDRQGALRWQNAGTGLLSAAYELTFLPSNEFVGMFGPHRNVCKFNTVTMANQWCIDKDPKTILAPRDLQLNVGGRQLIYTNRHERNDSLDSINTIDGKLQWSVRGLEYWEPPIFSTDGSYILFHERVNSSISLLHVLDSLTGEPITALQFPKSVSITAKLTTGFAVDSTILLLKDYSKLIAIRLPFNRTTITTTTTTPLPPLPTTTPELTTTTTTTTTTIPPGKEDTSSSWLKSSQGTTVMVLFGLGALFLLAALVAVVLFWRFRHRLLPVRSSFSPVPTVDPAEEEDEEAMHPL